MDFLNEIKLKSQTPVSNSNILMTNKEVETRQNNDPLLKTYYPTYLYKPPFGYPRNVNVVFLRELAKNPYVFAVIKAIIDQAAETKWEIKPKDGVTLNAELEQSQRYITEFFKNPNSDYESFAQILRKLISDILILDSGCLIKVYNRKKELLQLRCIDAGAILKNPDEHGSIATREDIISDTTYYDFEVGKGFTQERKDYKLAVDRYNSYGYTDQAAYFQFAYGINYSVPIPYGKKELIYMMENPASDTVYSRGSALESARDITLNLIYSSKASLDLFLNANIPTGIIQLAEANSDEAKNFRDRLYDQQYSGFDEYGFQRKVNGKLPVVGNPSVNFIPLNFKTNESQLLEIQQWFTKVLWMCFGINSSELGFTQGDSRATDESQTKNNARKAVKPRLNLIQNYLNDQVMPELPNGDLFEFCFDEYDQEVEKNKWDLYEQKLRMGVISPEMVMRKEGIDLKEIQEDKKNTIQNTNNTNTNTNNTNNNDNNKDVNVEEDNSINDNKIKSTETKSIINTENRTIVTGNSLEDVLEQTLDKIEDDKSNTDNTDTDNNSDDTTQDDDYEVNPKKWLYDGAKEYNEDVENILEDEEEKNLLLKSNDKIIPKKTALELVMEDFYKEFNIEVKDIIEKVTK